MSIKGEWAKAAKAFDALSKTFIQTGVQEGALRGISTSILGITETIINLENVGTFVKMKAAMILSEIGVDLLYNTLPVTPEDTGELKESGTVTLQFFGGYKDIAKGTKDDYVNRIGEPSLNQTKKATKMNVLVSFVRTNEFGEDIALWAHEELNPYGSSTHPRARKYNTGPKYLENTWNQRKAGYINQLNTIGDIEEAIRASSAVIQKAKSKFAVDVIKVDLNKLLSKAGRGKR